MNGKLTPRYIVGALLLSAFVFALASGSALARCGTCHGQGECAGAAGCGAHKEGAACACKVAAAAEATELSPLAAAAKAKVEAAGVGFLTAEQLGAKLKSKTPPVVVDVLSPKSFAASHIEGAINIPMGDIAKTAPKLLKDKNAEIVVYCGSYQCGESQSRRGAEGDRLHQHSRLQGGAEGVDRTGVAPGQTCRQGINAVLPHGLSGVSPGRLT